MGVVALVTSTYNFMKQRNNYKKDVQVWKENYENYIHRIIKRIKEWQKSDIKYLNSVYPNMDTLFKNTAEIHSSIFRVRRMIKILWLSLLECRMKLNLCLR